METKNTELIDRFLNGELKGQELKDFEERLKTDDLLQKELHLEKELNTVISDEDTLNFREEVIQVRENMKKEDLSNRNDINTISLNNRNRQWYLVAASIVIMMGLTVYFAFFKEGSLTNDQLFADYYGPYEVSTAIRSDAPAEHDQLIRGLIAYEASNYEDAVDNFKTTLSNDPSNNTARFYLGISYIETNNLSLAEKEFMLINDQNSLLFGELAKWYLALTWIKMDSKDSMKQIKNLLQEIVSLEGDRKEEAEKLLRQIKSVD